jgi:glycosyltransferase involved in cell wall biosynthesis
MNVSAATPSVCFVGLENLPVLAKEYSHRGIGGAQLQQTLLAKALVRRGWRVCMVVADYGQPDGARWDDITTYKGYRYEAGLPGVRFFHPRWTGIWAALKRADCQVYYVSGANMLVGEVALFARRHARRAVFRVASDSDCDPRKVRLGSWRHRTLFHYGLHRVDAILAQTATQRAALAENHGLTTTIAPSLIEAGESSVNFADREISVLWVSNIRRLKRPRLLLGLARQLPDLRFQMAGGPLPEESALFEQTRQEASSLSNVRFFGLLAYQEVSKLCERCRVLVNTSEVEGFPNTFLQAWMRGTPVITFVDPDGLVAREGLGRVVTSPDELRDAVKSLSTDQSAWLAASERCRAFVIREYGGEKILAPYIATLESLVTQTARDEV